MEGLKKIAVKSYNKKELWTREERSYAKSFFKKLDSNGDKKVSFEELRRADIISSDLCYLFSRLDTNGDGGLDFEEVLALFFYKNVQFGKNVVMAYKPSARLCRAKSPCSRWLDPRPDFSCFLCLFEQISYHLCSSCHGKGEHYYHKHSDWYMLNSQSMDVLSMLKYVLFGGEYQATPRQTPVVISETSGHLDNSSSRTMDYIDTHITKTMDYIDNHKVLNHFLHEGVGRVPDAIEKIMPIIQSGACTIM